MTQHCCLPILAWCNLKDYFLGNQKPNNKRAVTSQKCVRAGGKHNDLENVGYTARHHTFFEMLGNFSFGDYFKQEAIKFCWEFLTEVLKLPKERLWVTVHISDDDAANIWINDIGFDPNRISRLDSDNFWQMGDTGPCGPCSEVFYDHGDEIEGDPPGGLNDDGDRYIEIWNLVFMQYEQHADGSMTPLPNPCVDTGMGLERIAAVMQHQHNNYDIDLFQNLLKAAAKVTNQQDLSLQSLRVIADHIRSSCFLIIDGVLPSNEGRGYVLRRILRRALRHGNKLGVDTAFFHQLVQPLCKEMGEAYPELVENQQRLESILLKEERQFAQTLNNGLGILQGAIESLDNDVVPGDIIFKLYDTYGFPTDLTNDIAREQGLTLDMDGYETCMQQQRQMARDSSKFESNQLNAINLEGSTSFTGYEQQHGQSTIKAMFDLEGNPIEILATEQQGLIVLNETPFYAESGGQVGDTGFINSDNAQFEVIDCQTQQKHYLHKGTITFGQLNIGDKVNTQIDNDIRRATAANHSATHLLHAVLREHLGTDVIQKGSLVDSQKLRFDFSYPKQLTTEQLDAICINVNQQIILNSIVSIEIMSPEQAKQKGAMALFGEKYGDQVRVLSMGNRNSNNDAFSVELCGGTHVNQTGDIGLFSIVSESGIAAGIRRIEAVTGQQAVSLMVERQRELAQIQAMLNASQQSLQGKIEQLLTTNKQLQKQNNQLQTKLASGSSADISADAVDVNGVKVLLKHVEGIDAKSLRSLMDKLKDKLGKSVVLLASSQDDGKVSLVAGVSQCPEVSAADLVTQVASAIDGKGGGRANMAQGGGTNIDTLPQALNNALEWIKNQL